ncbi:conserved hypothetical protein [Actinomyces sp. oral taxon 180 str. F0310]|nr:conserved hypothetical protein [Actinomyces sp. oral taxon 180 str. F0310]
MVNHPLEEGESFIDASRVLICACKIRKSNIRMGVIFTQDTKAIGANLFIQGDCFIDPFRVLQSSGKIVACC